MSAGLTVATGWIKNIQAEGRCVGCYLSFVCCVIYHWFTHCSLAPCAGGLYPVMLIVRQYSVNLWLHPRVCLQSGTSLCTRVSCPVMDCPPEERTKSEDGCCDTCPTRRLCTFQGAQHSVSIVQHRAAACTSLSVAVWTSCVGSQGAADFTGLVALTCWWIG